MTAPESRAAESLPDEFRRLLGEYNDDADPATKEEAWNLIADFAVDNCETIYDALSALTTSAAAEAAMREAAEFYLDEQWGDVIDEPPVEMLAWLETHRPDCKGDIALARALSTPASAQAERMMRLMKAAKPFAR